MTLEQFGEWLGKAVADHWLEMAGGLVALAAGRYWGRRRARREWERKEFMHRLMLSLNSIVSDASGRPTLAIRTLLEKNLREVFLNDIASQKVLEAAGKTTAADPILPIAPDDRWHLLNAVLNEVAETFSAGTLARDLGLPVRAQRYLICLTNEVAGPVRTQKVRAMVVRRDRLLAGAFENLALESDHHSTRLDTLRHMRATYSTTPGLFLEVDLAVPAATA